ncbi:MAG: tetratricopeptide repeat protein [Acidobacteria bacterium]|nr:tetratricopeptide repeat protein [Acidobacteriota bacterium]
MNRYVVFSFVFVSMALACGPRTEPETPASDAPTLQEARDTVAACRSERVVPERWQRAATAFRNAAADGSLPEGAAPEADLAAAMVSLHDGRAAEAQLAAERALSARANWDCALGALGEAQFTLGDVDAARETLLLARAAAPDWYLPPLRLGVIARWHGSPTDALSLFQEAARLDPTRADPQLEIGLLQGEWGHATDAVSALRAAAELDPAWANAHLELSRALLASGDAAGARSAAAEALRRQPGWADALEAIARIDLSENKLDDAAAKFGEALAADPRFAAAEAGLGEVEEARGNAGAAAEHYRRAAELNPAAPDGLAGQARLARAAGDLPRAESLQQQAVALVPGNAAVRLELARVLFLEGKTAEAAEQLGFILQRYPGHPGAVELQGSIGAE